MRFFARSEAVTFFACLRTWISRGWKEFYQKLYKHFFLLNIECLKIKKQKTPCHTYIWHSIINISKKYVGKNCSWSWIVFDVYMNSNFMLQLSKKEGVWFVRARNSQHFILLNPTLRGVSEKYIITRLYLTFLHSKYNTFQTHIQCKLLRITQLAFPEGTKHNLLFASNFISIFDAIYNWYLGW